jgi:hypothetical protein
MDMFDLSTHLSFIQQSYFNMNSVACKNNRSMEVYPPEGTLNAYYDE